jgi:hypothetical protein
MLERALATRICPVAPQLLPLFLVCVVVFELLSSRTAIDILVTEIDKVLLAETTLASMPDVIGFGSVTEMPD